VQAVKKWTETIDTIEGFAVAHRAGSETSRGSVLIVPPFGVPATTLRVVADAVVADGFDTVLLDPRDHVGAGSGTIENFRVSQLADDCAEAMRRFEPVCVVGVSLGARALLRALAR
jgi:pimeloyl-ACP methyl ester carboxylesterase